METLVLDDYEKIDPAELQTGDEVLFKGKKYYLKPNGSFAYLYQNKEDFDRKTNAILVARSKMIYRKKGGGGLKEEGEESDSYDIFTPSVILNEEVECENVKCEKRRAVILTIDEIEEHSTKLI